MREIIILSAMIWGLWQSDVALAAKDVSENRPGAISCQQLIRELKSYREAQTVLMQNFLQKNETVAETLEIYASKLDKNDKKSRKSNQASLQKVAQAYRSHGDRESKLVQKFDASSAALLDQVSVCLSRNEPIATESNMTR